MDKKKGHLAKKKMQKGTKSSVDSRKIKCVPCFGEWSQYMNPDTTSPTTFYCGIWFLESRILTKRWKEYEKMEVKIRNKRIEWNKRDRIKENTREWTHLTMCNEQRNNNLHDLIQLQKQSVKEHIALLIDDVK